MRGNANPFRMSVTIPELILPTLHRDARAKAASTLSVVGIFWTPGFNLKIRVCVDSILSLVYPKYCMGQEVKTVAEISDDWLPDMENLELYQSTVGTTNRNSEIARHKLTNKYLHFPKPNFNQICYFYNVVLVLLYGKYITM